MLAAEIKTEFVTEGNVICSVKQRENRKHMITAKLS